MVGIDDFSRHPVLQALNLTRLRIVLPNLRVVFGHFGIPEQVKTDNEPSFQDTEFAEFAQELGF